jgi:hypothetical protein
MATEGGSQVGEGWPKWQIALAVGTPVVLGAAGIWLYKRNRSSNTEKDKEHSAKADNAAVGSTQQASYVTDVMWTF